MNTPAEARAARLCEAWQVHPQRTAETATSSLVFGVRDDQRVVLKVEKDSGSERLAGSVLAAFGGAGTPRVLEHATGAVLMEEIVPGTSLAEVVARGDDASATDILVRVISEMQTAARLTSGVPTVRAWGASFEAYLDHDRGEIPAEVAVRAHQTWMELCATAPEPRLLHGDLHHHNILFDARRGWLAIDPKGVIGDLAFEAGAALRNPHGMPSLMRPEVIDRRVRQLAQGLDADPARILRWAFAQAVLACVWMIEDGTAVTPDTTAMLFAMASQDHPFNT